MLFTSSNYWDRFALFRCFKHYVTTVVYFLDIYFGSDPSSLMWVSIWINLINTYHFCHIKWLMNGMFVYLLIINLLNHYLILKNLYKVSKTRFWDNSVEALEGMLICILLKGTILFKYSYSSRHHVYFLVYISYWLFVIYSTCVGINWYILSIITHLKITNK